MELVAKLRYMGRQYANGQAARGGGQQKHYLEEAADEIEALRAKAARWDAIETLMILGDVELTQTEDGGYSIYVEPVENILPTSWNGDTPDQVADKVAAQLTTPNDRVERPGAASGDRSARTTGCAAPWVKYIHEALGDRSARTTGCAAGGDE